jgi:hypothetical protein
MDVYRVAGDGGTQCRVAHRDNTSNGGSIFGAERDPLAILSVIQTLIN